MKAGGDDPCIHGSAGHVSNPTGRGDPERHGLSSDAVALGHASCRVEECGDADVKPVEKGSDHRGALLFVNQQDSKPGIARLGVSDKGEFGSTGSAPGGKKIDQDGATVVGSQFLWLASSIDQLKVGSETGRAPMDRAKEDEREERERDTDGRHRTEARHELHDTLPQDPE